MSQGNIDPANFTPESLSDPSIDAVTLRQLAMDRPDLWPHILQHPNCYAGLSDYIRQQMPQPPTPSHQPGEQPTAAQPEQEGPGAGEQIAAGARKAADGAKEYWSTTAGPAVSSASKNAQAAVKANQNNWQFWVRLGQPVIAFFAFITLFTPAVRVRDEFNIEGHLEGLAEQWGLSNELSAARDELGLHTTQNFLTQDMTFAGVILLLLLLATIAAAVTSLATNNAMFKLVAGAAGALTGLFGVILSIIYLVVAGDDHLSAGIGAVLMLILSILLIGASVITALPQNRSAVPQS